MQVTSWKEKFGEITPYASALPSQTFAITNGAFLCTNPGLHTKKTAARELGMRDTCENVLAHYAAFCGMTYCTPTCRYPVSNASINMMVEI